MRLIKLGFLLMTFLSFTSLNCQPQTVQHLSVLVCYGKVNPDKIRGYKYVILESEQYSEFDIKLIQENNEIVLGYLSIGEVSPARYYYSAIKDNTLGKNEIWDSYYLDLSDKNTQNVLMSQVGKIREKGFDGLFLDTVDTYAKWGAYPERGNELIHMLSLIKGAYPELHLMQNAGLSLVPKSANYVSSLAIESIASAYDHEKQQYQLRKEKEFYTLLNELKELESTQHIPIVLIEYADSKKLYRKINQQLQSLEWDYFIGKIELQDIPNYN